MSIFRPNLGKSKQFQYKPRFYDEEKEKLENMRKRYASGEDYIPGQIVKMGLRKHQSNIENRRKRKPKTIRFTILLFLALALIYFVFIR